jgi:4-amino-4-deoxy-L-arabinose transferase-like glycosyltransferase
MPTTRPNPRSLAMITLFWAILQLGGLFTPGLLDDVDSVYIEIAREMLVRHDFVTPYIDGIRFFDKPPLMYWLAAGSMHLFGQHAWAARLPLALAMLALLFAIYALGLRLFARTSAVANPDRGALYAALAFATALGPYLYTRFFIPDMLICLWMTLGVHLFLIALDRAATRESTARGHASALLPSLGFAACLALNLLTKGFIGLVFPLGFVAIYLFFTRQWKLAPRLHLLSATVVFLAIALPWHVLAALRNPAIAMPPGVGLPARAGWAWFYLYNEHVARFLSKRIPHDYGQTPVWLFWLYAVLWMFPWAAFLPGTFGWLRRALGRRSAATMREQEAALTLTIWPVLVLGFFTLSARQEYYSLPALPAFALLAGGMLARADRERSAATLDQTSALTSLALHRWLLLPIAALVAVTCLFFAIEAPRPAYGVDLASLLAQNPSLYNLSLGHIFDLTGAAMGLFRGPLIAVALGMVSLGPVSFALRRRAHTYAANLTLAAGMTLVLLAAHEGLVRFNPILGSKLLADAILSDQTIQPKQGDMILLDGELTSGSTLLFYTRQRVYLVNGRENGPWFGSFWPEAPHIFEDESSLRRLWAGPNRIFLMTYAPASRAHDLASFAPVHLLASAGGKTVLVNQ